MRQTMTRGLLLATLMIAIIAGAGYGAYQSYRASSLAGFAPTVVNLPRGSSFAAVVRRLQEAGVLEYGWPFKVMARLQGKAGTVKAGEYRIEPGITPQRLLDRLVKGDVLLHRLTIIEGWNFQDLRAALRRHDAVRQTLGPLSGREIMERLGHPQTHPEGRFFPDTYLFPRGTADQILLQRAYQAMEEALAAAWRQRDPDLPLDSPYAALVLASIIEKETALASERRQIAGVFIRRLRRGMPLQTDPTVIYGLGQTFDGNLTRQHLRQDQPYNTYRHRGLPPTPIAMPGRESLLAAVQPADGDSLFFVSRGDGSHIFSATLEAHRQAVRCYQLKRCTQ